MTLNTRIIGACIFRNKVLKNTGTAPGKIFSFFPGRGYDVTYDNEMPESHGEKNRKDPFSYRSKVFYRDIIKK